jgi:DNA polymerase-3 subunit delta'
VWGVCRNRRHPLFYFSELCRNTLARFVLLCFIVEFMIILLNMEQKIKFDWSIIGHKNITGFLESSIINNKISHAYLFYGPAHVGKTTVALKFVSFLLGRDLTALASHPDIYWIKREKDEKSGKSQKNISIKQIRELEQKLSLSSFLNSYKIAIIEEAETLSREACDSLLKTLEEPKDKIVIILIAENIGSLPRTILSRCQILKFLPVSRNEIFEFLISRKSERETAQKLSSLAEGKPGTVFEFLKDFEENPSASPSFKIYQEKVDGLIDLVNSSSFVRKLEIIDRLVPKTREENIASWKEILNIWTLILRDLLLMKSNCAPLVSHRIFEEKLKAVMPKFNAAEIMKLIEEVKKTQEYISLNINFKLALENLILNF